MKSKKSIRIATHCFELTVHWNGGYLLAQVAIILGLSLTRLFSRHDAVDRMCMIFLLIDAFVILFSLLYGFHVESVDGESNDIPKKESINIDIRSTDKEKKLEGVSEKQSKSAKKPVKETSGEIKNKVAIPNPSASRHGRQMSAVRKSVSESVDHTVGSIKVEPAKDPIQESTKVQPSTPSMEEIDWASIFSMED